MSEKPKKIDWQGILQEPYRVFFPLAMLLGLLGVGHWLWYAMEWSSYSSSFYHASVQVWGYMVCFILGFLMTALPRFSTSFPTTPLELTAIILLLLGQQGFAWIGQWGWAQACWVGLLLVLALFAGRRFATKRAEEVKPPIEFVWIGIALFLGLGGALLTALGQAGWLPSMILKAGVPMSQQGFLLGIIVGVGGFMAPRLMGHPFEKGDRKRQFRLHLAAGALFTLSFLLEGLDQTRIAYFLRAFVVTAALFRLTRFYRPPRAEGLYVRLLWLSLWMIVIGLWGVAGMPVYRVTMLHMVFLGGFSLMTYAVGTMVVLSHSGEVGKLKKPLGILRLVVWGVGISLVCRLAADFHPEKFFILLAIASILWMGTALGWLFFILPKVISSSDHEELRRIHRQAGVRS